ncbi:MAG: GIY-YIG nuclease family protein [Pseudomonadota bacterium]
MARRYSVYILASRPFGPIYIGVTNNLIERIIEHREGRGSRYVFKYKIFRLVCVEDYDRIEDAIAREKRLKRWKRVWKDELIEKTNPDWHDLFDQIKGDPLSN